MTTWPRVGLIGPSQGLEAEAVWLKIAKEITKHKCQPVHMSDWRQQGGVTPKQRCIDEMFRNDLIVVVTTLHPGSVVPGTDLPFSELEVQVAARIGIPRLAFLPAADKRFWTKDIEKSPDGWRRINRMNDVLAHEHVDFYRSHDNLVANVGEAVRIWRSEKAEAERNRRQKQSEFLSQNTEGVFPGLEFAIKIDRFGLSDQRPLARFNTNERAAWGTVAFSPAWAYGDFGRVISPGTLVRANGTGYISTLRCGEAIREILIDNVNYSVTEWSKS